MNDAPITPKTKVGDLLESYPELEETLISLSPAFEKLRNPILRRTIARVATLQQIAAVGNIPLEKIINTLREAAGQSRYNDTMDEQNANTKVPAWLDEQNITDNLDAREMLERGEHPLSIVLEKAHRLESGKILELVTSFPPMPLIDKVEAMGLKCFMRQVSGNEVRTYFLKK